MKVNKSAKQGYRDARAGRKMRKKKRKDPDYLAGYTQGAKDNAKECIAWLRDTRRRIGRAGRG